MASTNSQSAITKAPSRCLCGITGHTYKECHNLNPYTRRQMWEMREPVIARINERLHKNKSFRKHILKRGYEYYRPIEQPTAPEPVNPLHKLANLPVELIERIVEWTYLMTLDELPDTHPLIHNKRTSEERLFRLRNPGPVPSILNLPAPKYKRKQWLERHPGNWGPLFQVMYVSKLFYEIAKPIRYREVHVQCEDPHGYLPFRNPFETLLSRLTTIQVLKEATKQIHLTIDLLDSASIMDLVTALATLPKLKHLGVTLKINPEGFSHSDMAKFNQDLLQFFGLKVETLTFIWVWGGYSQLALTEPNDRSADSAYAPVPSKAEYQMQQVRNRFMEETYKPSSWYSASNSNNGPILPGQCRTSHDWTAQKIRGYTRAPWDYAQREMDGGYVQWEMDTFTFANCRTERPLWNLETNPYNHPSQLKKKELEASRPLRVWRKGFDPYEKASDES